MQRCKDGTKTSIEEIKAVILQGLFLALGTKQNRCNLEKETNCPNPYKMQIKLFCLLFR